MEESVCTCCEKCLREKASLKQDTQFLREFGTQVK